MGKKLSDDTINKIIEYNKQNLTDVKISKLLNCSTTSIWRIRKKFNLDNNYKKENRRFCEYIPLTNIQKEILYGTLLGDSSLQYINRKKSMTPIFSCEHSIKQKDYAFLLADKLNGVCKERIRYDSRTNKTYVNYIVTTKSNIDYIEIYNKLYINKIKYITKEYLKNFTEVSLCYLFMDDGYSANNTIYLCTDSFDNNSCDNLINACIDKFDIHFKKIKHGKYIRLRLLFADREKFIKLISPYLIDNMKYKLDKINL